MRHGKLPRDERTGLYEVDLETLRVIVGWSEGLPRASVIAEALGLADEASARARMKRLERSGHLERIALGVGLPTVPRVTHKGREALGMVEPLPIVQQLAPAVPQPVYPLPCGPLGEAIAEPEYVDTPFADWRAGDYLVFAEGESMWNPQTARGILPGSKLQMRPDVYPENGQIVHAELVHEDGIHECTLKVFHQCERTGIVTLQAINPEYSDIVLPADRVIIKGVAQDMACPVMRFARRDRK